MPAAYQRLESDGSGSLPPFASRGPRLGQDRRGWARIVARAQLCMIPSAQARAVLGNTAPSSGAYLQLALTIDSLVTLTGPAGMLMAIVSFPWPPPAMAGAPVTVTVCPTC